MNMPIGLGSARDLPSVGPSFGPSFKRPFALGAPLTPQGQHGLSVLVVDDEAEVLEELTLALGRRGLPVLSAGSARMALSVLASRPDVGALVTDIRMPGMDGIALAEAALAHRRDVDALEVLLVTGYASAAQGLAASRLGAFGMLQKPMRGADLARMVGEALKRAAERRDATRGQLPWGFVPDAFQPPSALIPSPGAATGFGTASLARDGSAGGLALMQREAPFPAQAEAPFARGGYQADDLAQDLADAQALEDGIATLRHSAVSAHGLAGAVAARLRSIGARCSHRITLQPDADPAFEVDTDRLLRAIDLLAHRALGGRAGVAELSIDAGAGQARLDLLLRPDAVEPAEPEPRPERSLPLAVARRLVAALGGGLDAWTIPTGGLRARLLIRGG